MIAEKIRICYNINMTKLKTLGLLFLSMFKIGLFTFGGGTAMISLLENEFVGKKKWLTADEFADLIVIAESTPGPIAINSATYIGYKTCGVLGSVVATLGMVIPSFVIIYVISLFFNRFLEIKWVSSAFRGIKIAVGILIVNAAVKMIVKMKKKPLPIAIAVCAFVAMMLINVFSLRFSSMILMLFAAAVSLIVYLAGRNADGQKEARK